MSVNIKKLKDNLLDKVDTRDDGLLKFNLPKTNNIINGFVRGELIIVGGRKTSGKSSFLLSNYIIHPMIEKFTHKEKLPMKLIYFNTKNSLSQVMEKMTVTYTAMKKKDTLSNNKISVASLYNYPGASKKVQTKTAKSMINAAFVVFNTFVDKGYLNVFNGSQTIDTIDTITRSLFEAYGKFDEHGDDFQYDEEHKKLTPIIVIDDASLVLGERFLGSVKNDNAFKLGIVLKRLAKILNAIVVLNVPSSFVYEKDNVKYYTNKIAEIHPYHIFADKVMFLHNPFETNDKHWDDYDTESFINKKGICYLRILSVVANSTGATNLQIPCFFFPESGTFMELPAADEVFRLEDWYDIVNDRVKKKEDEDEDPYAKDTDDDD